MTVVSDTSVLIYLLHVGRLDVLRDLFGQVHVPDAVLRELSVVDREARVVSEAAWITVVSEPPPNDRRLELDRFRLDPGERAALALALTAQNTLVLIDDAAARAAARELGLAHTGLLGICGRAKQIGLIPEARPLLQAMVRRGFRIAPALLEGFLATLGE